MKSIIAVFDTTHETLRAEDFFRAEKVKFRPVLKPRRIGGACRMALQFGEEDIGAARRAVKSGTLALKAFFRKEGDQWQKLDSGTV